MAYQHDDVTKWKHLPRYWPFVRGIHRSPMDSPHKGKWRGALVFFCAWINAWVNNREVGDLGRHRTHYDVIVRSPRSRATSNISVDDLNQNRNSISKCMIDVQHICSKFVFPFGETAILNKKDKWNENMILGSTKVEQNTGGELYIHSLILQSHILILAWVFVPPYMTFRNIYFKVPSANLLPFCLNPNSLKVSNPFWH